jgi:hypothetical protein
MWYKDSVGSVLTWVYIKYDARFLDTSWQHESVHVHYEQSTTTYKTTPFSYLLKHISPSVFRCTYSTLSDVGSFHVNFRRTRKHQLSSSPSTWRTSKRESTEVIRACTMPMEGTYPIQISISHHLQFKSSESRHIVWQQHKVSVFR